jgi:REP element-mobilizing transposase RayT
LYEDEKAKVIVMNGMPDHIHMLIETKPSIFLPDLVRKVKEASSKWVSQNFSNLENFNWQEGYSVFSVGYSTKESVIKYIQHQEEHHQNISYDDEYTTLLNMQDIKFDERFVLG